MPAPFHFRAAALHGRLAGKFETQGLARGRVPEFQAAGVKLDVARPARSGTVFDISDDGTSHGGHLRPDLVVPSGIQRDFGKATSAFFMQDLVMEPCKLRAGGVGGTNGG